MTAPGNTPRSKRRASGEAHHASEARVGGKWDRREKRLREALADMNRPNGKVAGAVMTIMEVMADVDRARAMRLVEAVAIGVAFATRDTRTVRP